MKKINNVNKNYWKNDLHNIIKECLTEVVSKASYMKGYTNNKGEHIPYSEIRYQQKYQTDDNNKKPRALSILVIKTIVDSYCKDVKIYRNNQDALLKIVRKLRNKVINGEGYKETIYNESTNGKTHILFDLNWSVVLHFVKDCQENDKHYSIGDNIVRNINDKTSETKIAD